MGVYLENIVYNELLSRGYNVNIGNIENGEIDFIATKYEEKIYIQVCFLLGDNDDVITREFGAYKHIDDNYPKYVISSDKFDMSQDGIIYKNIIDWLLNKGFFRQVPATENQEKKSSITTLFFLVIFNKLFPIF